MQSVSLVLLFHLENQFPKCGFYCVDSQLQNLSPGAYVYLGSLVSAPYSNFELKSKWGWETDSEITDMSYYTSAMQNPREDD